MEESKTLLGFCSQKENPYNKLLPYAEKLDRESNDQLAIIKANLGRTIHMRDIKVGATHWTAQLQKYIRLHGLKFSKEDHLLFIKIGFELVTTPDLELSNVVKFSHLLNHLLKKRDLLSRDDLVLEWRPLYKLLEKVAYSSYEHHGLVLFPDNVESVLKNLVKVCRVYFPLDCTQEMLNEWRPLLCPFDVTMLKGTSFLELFLPTNIPTEHHDKGFRLWFDELIGLWDACQNSPSWETNLVNLFSRLALNNIGSIDWEPWLPKIFTRVLRSFNLPVGSAQVQVTRSSNCYDVCITVQWITSMMGGGSKTQVHIDKLFTALESFYHPSNMTRRNNKLMKLMLRFPQFVVRRLHRERYKKPTWDRPIPDSHRLTEDEVTRFVEGIRPIVYMGMFSKLGSNDSAVALQHLACLRPQLVIPDLLEQTYPALETLTEPHRLSACLHCVVAVGRAMLENPKDYPEGKMHVLPLLNLCLPGIDPNDIKKCLMTFQLVSTLVSLLPLVDCSEAQHYRTDLTDDERELCSATAQFEDFVVLFLDRIFVLMENSALMHPRTDSATSYQLTTEESFIEVGILSTLSAIMQQSSAKIYGEFVSRVFRFVSTSVFEIRVAGRFAADIARSAIKANPEIGLDRFMIHFCQEVQYHFSNEDLSNEEHLDNEVLWNLKMMSEIVRCNGQSLLRHKTALLDILKATLHLKCKEASNLSGTLLRHLLRALTLIYVLDYRSTTIDWDLPLSEVLPIREWGKAGDLNNLQMKWHVPTPEEKQFAAEILETFLVDELDRVTKHVSGDVMTREELQQSLSIITHCLVGAGSELPSLTGETSRLVDSLVELTRFSNISSTDEEGLTLNGQNIRMKVTESMRPLLDHIFSTSEDDTKSLIGVIKIYSCLLLYFGNPKDDFEGRWKSFHMVKKSLENKLIGKKHHMRALLVERVQLQHELRVVNRVAKITTNTHMDLLKDLFRMSISRYSEVRKTAQSALSKCFQQFAYSYRELLDDIILHLKDYPSIEHEQFKGALYIILGEGKRSLVTKRNWNVMNKLWPALVQAHHSEKPTILKLLDSILERLHKNVETTELKIKVHDKLLSVAKQLWTANTWPQPALPIATEEEMQIGKIEEDKRNQEYTSSYYELVNKLVDLLEAGTLSWKFYQMAIEMLSLMIRHDIRTPARAVRFFVKNLVADTLHVRKISIGVVSALLKQQKRPHKKIVIDPYKISNATPPANVNDIRTGDTTDNTWLMYNSKELPDTREKWNTFDFVEKTHWGYYTWPRPMYKYAPVEEQPKLGRSIEELSEEEKPLYEHFTNPEFVENFIKFLALEEQKGKDKFHSKYFTLFKGLFRNFDDACLDTFKPHVERLVADTAHDTHECNQRCAAEMIAACSRGCKHWSYEKTSKMWEWLIPVMSSAINNMTVESIGDWGTCYATASESRDPRKVAHMLELLMDNPLRGNGGSFGDSSRLYVLQGALAQQEWRVPQLLHRCLDYLMPNLFHPYKIVRDRLSSVLVSIFLYDLSLPNGELTTSPRLEPFIEKVLPLLEVLEDSATDNNGASFSFSSIQSAGDAVQSVEIDKDTRYLELQNLKLDSPENGNDVENGENEERKTAIRLCKTLLKWLQGVFSRMFQCVPSNMFKFLPVMCILSSESQNEELLAVCDGTLVCMTQVLVAEHSVPVLVSTLQQICLLKSESRDEELKQKCLLSLACFGQTLLTPEVIPTVLATIQQVAELSSWHARVAILEYMQVMVFCNLFLLQDDDIVRQLQTLVINLLCDERVEVRETAAVTLSGFLQCGYMSINQDMMTLFGKLRRTKIKKRGGPVNPDLLIKRHSGVLGLSACIQAFPYDVPEGIPQILMDLGEHLDDPQPIQMTVKKTLSNFKRTHHDNWQDHKHKFRDDQLVVLTDLLVSPNYYA